MNGTTVSSAPYVNIERPKPSVAYVIDPRFPGGTTSAVAQELRAIGCLVTPNVYAISSRMFKGRNVSPALESAIEDLGLQLRWDPKTISADVAIVHNPSFLKFQEKLNTNILAKRVFVVTHENFIRPGGKEAFDVSLCLEQIDYASVALKKYLAPISPYNRSTIRNWFGKHKVTKKWPLLSRNWFNICDFPQTLPTENPADRRGRHSRPGFEKFPSLADMELCFPEHAASNVILGADSLMEHGNSHPHWTMIPFRGVEVEDFFRLIDFMVYFTSPMLRESFGRVLAEAIAAGKIVISDEGTASTFGDAVISATPKEVDSLISYYIQNPKEYQEYVAKAQRKLAKFSAHAFRKFFRDSVLSVN